MPDGPNETYEDPIAPAREPQVPDSPHLFVILEGERPRAGGARFSLDQCDEVVLARGARREATATVDGRTRRLTIALPDRRMSGVHAKLTWTGQRWVFEDAGSRNGSIVNGRAAQRAVLADHDVIQVGHTLLLLRPALPTPHGTPDALDTAELTAPLGMRTLMPALSKEIALLEKVAQSRVSVLVRGETGTGKELVARAVHALGRASGPLVAVNCGAIPANLVESQLFGHVRGAFSGAIRDEPGFVRAADGGTLFLDEVGDLPLAAQPALLRVLQEHEVVPVGSTKAQPADVRVVSATHKSLDDLVDDGTFRDDLLARLAGFSFALPPLRNRRGDLGLIIADLLASTSITSIEPDAAAALLRYRWPQNIRELGRALSLAAVIAEGGALKLAHLPPVIPRSATAAAAPEEDDDEAPGEPPPVRAELIAQLEQKQGKIAEVARAMGTRRTQVYRWLKALRIDPNVYRKQ